MDKNTKLVKLVRKFYRQKPWNRAVTTIAAVIIFVTTYMLILPAITMTGDPVCGMEEHTHSAECYSRVEHRSLACPYADSKLTIVHKHDESCYQDGVLICPLKEVEAHTHTAECYGGVMPVDPAGTAQTPVIAENTAGTASTASTQSSTAPLAEGSAAAAVMEEEPLPPCGKKEVILHTHDKNCYDVLGQLICTRPEVIEHQHTDACFTVTYEEVLTCTLPEHLHTDACYEKQEDVVLTPEDGTVLPEEASLSQIDVEGAGAAEGTLQGEPAGGETEPSVAEGDGLLPVQDGTAVLSPDQQPLMEEEQGVSFYLMPQESGADGSIILQEDASSAQPGEILAADGQGQDSSEPSVLEQASSEPSVMEQTEAQGELSAPANPEILEETAPAILEEGRPGENQTGTDHQETTIEEITEAAPLLEQEAAGGQDPADEQDSAVIEDPEAGQDPATVLQEESALSGEEKTEDADATGKTGEEILPEENLIQEETPLIEEDSSVIEGNPMESEETTVSVTEGMSEITTEVLPASETGAEGAVEPMTEAAAEADAEPMTEAAAEAATEQKIEAATDAAAEQMTEVVAEAATEPMTEAAAEAATEPMAEAVTEAGIEQITEAVAEAATEPMTEAIAEAFTEQMAEAVTEAAAGQMTETIAEAATEQVTEASTEAVTEKTTKWTTEAATEQTTQEITYWTTERETEQTTEQTTEAGNETTTSVLEYEGSDYKVRLTLFPSSGIPQGAYVEAREILPGDEEGLYETYLAESKKALGLSEDTTLPEKYARFFDIRILDQDGNEIEPTGPVKVDILYDEPVEGVGENSPSANVLHFDDESMEAQLLTPPVPVENAQENTAEETEGFEMDDVSGQNEQQTPAGDEQETSAEGESQPASSVDFTTDGFSVYGVVYTVDFHYDVNGKTYDFSIPGGGFVALSDVLQALVTGTASPEAEENLDGQDPGQILVENAGTGFEDAAVREFLKGVEKAEFSNPALVWVGKAEAETVVGSLKEANGLEVQYSADLTEEQIEQINAQTVQAGDWALISLLPFTTEESLTVTMINGEQFVIRVTDAQTSEDLAGRHGVTNQANVGVYSGYNTQFFNKPIDTIETEGTRVTILGTESSLLYYTSWYQISYEKSGESVTGYVKTKYIDILDMVDPVTSENDVFKVTASWEERVLPEGTVLESTGPFLTEEERKDLENQALSVLPVSSGKTLKATGILFFDLSFMADGKEIEPDGEVNVSMELKQPIETKEKEGLHLVHFTGGTAELLENTDFTKDESGNLRKLDFTVGSFSTFAVVRTIETTVVASDGNSYDVKVYYTDDANIPVGSTLRVTEFAEGSNEYNYARKAVLADKQAKGEKISRDNFGFALMDISILDKSGNEIEPSAEVWVDITIESLPGVDDLKEIENNIAIQHHVRDNENVIVDEVFNGAAKASFDLPAKGIIIENKGDTAVDPTTFSEEEYWKEIQDQEIISEDTDIEASFSTLCFSQFSVTWYYGQRKVTVHYGYMSGDKFVEFEQQPAPVPEGVFNTTEAYLTYDFEGWQAKNEVYYYNGTTNYPRSDGTQIHNTLYKDTSGRWLYKKFSDGYSMPRYGVIRHFYGMGNYYDEDLREAISKNVLSDNSHIYVLYEPKPGATQGGTPVPVNEGGDKPQNPDITKTSVDNNDGTNTIQLTVEGHTTPLKTKKMADVILIFDTSGSMNFKMDKEEEATTGWDTPRITATKDAAYKLIDTLLDQNEGETGANARFRVGLVPFSNEVHDIIDLTTDKAALKKAVRDLNPNGGTNWEQALQKANEMSVATDRATFVIFITDGNPTFRMTRGNYTDAQLGTLSYNQQPSGLPTSDLSIYHAQYNVFGPGSGDWTENTNAVQNGGHVSMTGSDGVGRNYNYALEQAKSIVSHGKNLFSLGIGPAVGRLETLTTAAGADGNYYPATSVNELNKAMEDIIVQIKGELGFSNVCITDGITPLTQTVQKTGMSDDLPPEDDFVYEKYRAVTEADVTAGTTALPVGEKDWFPWDPQSEGAALASYKTENGAVEWNLGEKFFLENGVKYRCSFKVWPSQEAYDTIAKLNNGTLIYESLDPNIREQITGNNNTGYTLLTNMPNDPEAQEAIGSSVGAVYSWQEATKVANVVGIVDNTVHSDEFDPVKELKLEKQKIIVEKDWENGLDEREQDSNITLNVIATDVADTANTEDSADSQDTTDTHNPFATVEVGKNTNPSWTNSVFISTGLLKVVDGDTIIYEKGHDFMLTEGEDLAYYWELKADTYRPMVITDSSKGFSNPTPVLLKKVTSQSDSFDYEIDGDRYEIIREGSNALKAINYRRSNLNLKKKVVDKDGKTDISDAVKDELFEFTITVNDKNGHDVWFSVNAVAQDESTKIKDLETNATAEEKNGKETGSYYVTSGKSFKVKIKPGWNLRLLNLPSGSTYTIVETDKEGYKFQGASIDHDGTIKVDDAKSSISGTIGTPNTEFVITAANKMTASTILIKKTDLDGNKALEGATFKLYKKNTKNVYELFRDTFTVGADGYSCFGLLKGEYKLEEQTSPDGYIITVKDTFFTLSENETKVITLAENQEMASVSGKNKDELSIKNEPGAALPNTGGSGTMLFTIFGSILTLAAGILLWRRRLV